MSSCKKQLLGYVYSYTDNGDSCDGYPRISKLYKTKNGCLKEMKLDAEEYAKSSEDEDDDEIMHEGEITYKGDAIDVEFECDCYCLYKLHEVWS